ncbi:CIR protein [Plasmodium chabaudi chabaudi]|uniref:CIR protein n=2 Tax=Plasmodium chabaudi TaxID=5825 RepID=A0A4V0K2R4_PLACU|nr:CIR protein [Plasmodium chabaudi chabaudi]CAC86468.1 cir2 protein [Plasmodium chabaudi]VTZ67124.1 CIR protein [Plasmodium chabaudi chabaudi]|eukprot:XP_016652862.1 CIR protein [Plasmodium chabaudi chabaudi]
MNKDLCDVIKGIDDLIEVEVKAEGIETIRDELFNTYCPTNKGGKMRQQGQDGYCIGYSETVISAFIHLQETLKNNDSQKKLDRDKLAQYAILWLSYKINQHPNQTFGTNDIYNNFKQYGYWNRKHNNYIEQIKKYVDIKDMTKLHEAFILLCNMYTEIDENKSNCTKCSQKASEFVKKFEILNDDPNHIKDSPYSQILLTLSKDYDNFKNCCNKKKGESCDFPSLPQISPKKSFAQNSLESPGHTSGHNSEDISSKSPMANKLIPGLLIFAAIPVFLGIAYKYSLFGFDKQRHRQYLREKIKKIKNKMASYV